MNKISVKLTSAALGIAACMAWACPLAQAAPPVLNSVFDGKTLNGWVQNPSNSFNVNATDGAIETTGNARGFLYNTTNYTSYRVIYSVKQNVWLHWPTVLFFGYSTTADAMDGIQFQLPEDFGWDYRPGKNVAIPVTTYGSLDGNKEIGVWFRCEILINQENGTADSAAAVLGSPAVHIMKFSDSTITKTACPFALQCHQSGVSDEYKDILIEVNPPYTGLVLLNLPGPSGLTATTASASQVNLTWTINSTTQTGFEVFNSVDNTNWNLVATTAASATSYSNTGLNPSTTYYYRVAAVTSNAISDYATGTATTSSFTLPNGTYKIINRNSGLALDVEDGSTANGTLVDQYTYQAEPWQQWTVTGLGSGKYEIIGVGSGKALDVVDQSLAPGALIDIYPYQGTGNQQWKIAPSSDGYVTVQGVQSGFWLDVINASTAPGAGVDQWSSDTGNNQQWIFQAP